MATAPKLMTVEELMRLPEDGQRHEPIAGELRALTPAGEEHPAAGDVLDGEEVVPGRTMPVEEIFAGEVAG
jgi:Uma2 family endonuclease